MKFSIKMQETIASIAPLNLEAKAQARARLEQLTMPHWALGRIMDLAEQLAAITGQNPPPVARRSIAIMAGDHGVAQEGVSLYPQEVTAQMVANFAAGGAGANALAKIGGAQLYIADIGCIDELAALKAQKKVMDYKVAHGTQNMAKGPAMTYAQAEQAIEAGIAIATQLAQNNDLLAAGEMGIANTTPAAAILSVIAQVDVDLATGRGTGLDDEKRLHKVAVIKKAIEINQPNRLDAMDVLCKVGGLEIAAIAGFYLGAAAARKAVVVDGFICTAGALIAQALCPAVTQYMIAAHKSVEPGHSLMLAHLGLEPLLALNFRLGEGTGASMSFPLFDAARAMLTDVATFAEAHVSEAQ